MRMVKNGFTMLEILIAVSLIAIVAGLGMPSFATFLDNQRLKSAAESLYSQIKYAHSEAIKNQSDMFVSFKSGTNWCFGIDDAGSCDCSSSNDCTINGTEAVVKSDDYKNISLLTGGFNLAGSTPFMTIDGTRGTVDIAGAAAFFVDGRVLMVQVGKMGNPDMCSNVIKGYSSC